MIQSKRALRDLYRAKIAAQISSSDLGGLHTQLEALFENQQGTWGAFSALEDEPQVKFQNLKTNVKWVYPRIEGEHIQFYDAPAQELTANKWGIREPNPAQHSSVDLSSLDGVCVAALAFDQKGYRLGRGKGYYDRALVGFKGRKVGVAFSWQVAEELPRDHFDIPMDTVVTENSIIEISRSIPR